uniref:Single-stranded DNA-binding protein n=4 Tax=unclassified bacterial viruses TaxID=12333 RepID=A0AAU6W0W8_9VIRU
MTEATKPRLSLADIRALAAAAKETAVDMTEVQKGGDGPKLLPEGYSLAYVSGVIEYGLQPQEFEGKATADADEVQLEFALLDEGYTGEDGAPYVVRTYPFKVSRNSKANAFKMFKALNWQNQHTAWIDLLGELIMVKIVQYDDSQKKKRSKIDTTGFLPPVDLRTKKPYPAPPFDESLMRVFLWDQPTMECWDLLHIEGTSEAGKSKNFLQEKLLSARNFAGSALEELLLGNGVKFTIPKPDVKPNAAESTKAAASGAALPDAELSAEDAQRLADAPFDDGTVVADAEADASLEMPDMPS